MFRKLGLLIGVLLLLCATARADSAIDWNGHTYKLFSDSVTWHEAKEKCEKAGGYLVTINSQEEQDFIRKQIMNRKGETFWIGFTDEEKEGVWRWINGEDREYSNWGANEPDNTDNQDYACIYSTAQVWSASGLIVGGWDDDNERARFGYICEWDY